MGKTKTTRVKTNNNVRRSAKTTEKTMLKTRPKKEEQEEIEPIDKEENLILNKNLEICEEDLLLFKNLENTYKPEPSKKNTSIHKKIKEEEFKDLLSNPAKDPKVKAVYEKYYKKNRRYFIKIYKWKITSINSYFTIPSKLGRSPLVN